MLFSQLIGQTESAAFLRQLVQQERAPHALLMIGPEGCGKLALALAYARYLLCEQPTAEDACGQCPQCRKSGKYIHPDLHFAFPVVGSKAISDHFLPQWRNALLDNPYLSKNDWLQLIGAENKQGNIGKEECVQIIKKLSLKTFESRVKIMLIWLPEHLGKEGNRLLKIIEEPPEDTHFILVAERSELILNTIRSRCQALRIRPLSDEAVEEGLRRRFPDSSQDLRAIALLAAGNFNTALQLAEQKDDDNAPLFLDWFRKCYRGAGTDLIQWTEQFAKLGRERQKYFVQYALHFMREYLVLKLTGDEQLRLQADELETARNMTRVLETEQVEHIVNLLNNLIFYIERNANPRILLTDASIRMHKIMRGKGFPADPVAHYKT